MALAWCVALSLCVLCVVGQPGIGDPTAPPVPRGFPKKPPTPSPTPTPTIFVPSPTRPDPGQNVAFNLVHASDAELTPDTINWVDEWAALVDHLSNINQDSSFYVSAGSNWRNGPGFQAGQTAAVQSAIRSALGKNELIGGPGRADLAIQTLVNLKASAVGIHEFDTGDAGFQSIIKESLPDWPGAAFPYLSANLDYTSSSRLSGLYTDEILPISAFVSKEDALNYKLSAATYIRTGDNYLYGIVGVTAGNLFYYSQSENVAVGNSLQYNNAAVIASYIQPYVDALTENGVTKIILLSSLGNITLAKAVATQLSGVDIVIEGGGVNEYSTKVMANSNSNLMPGDTIAEPYPYWTNGKDGNPVVLAYTKGQYKYAGFLKVTFDPSGVILTADGDVYAATTANLLKWDVNTNTDVYRGAQAIASSLSDVFAYLDARVDALSSVFVDGQFATLGETNMGDLIADSFYSYVAGKNIPVNCALISGGSITGNFGSYASPASKITQLDVSLALKDNFALTVVNVTALGLKSELENAATRLPVASFPQVSRLKVRYLSSKPVGSRIDTLYLTDASGAVVDVIVYGGGFYGDPYRIIAIATTTFLANGHHGYSFPLSAVAVTSVPEFNDSTIAMHDYLTQNYLTTPYAQDGSDDRVSVNVSP